MPLSAPINAVIGLSAALLLQTTVGPLQEFLGPIERLTLVGALVIAVRTLYTRSERKDRENTEAMVKKDKDYTDAMAKKDEQILAMTTKVVETLTLTHAAMDNFIKVKGGTK